jgi:hypothetical protein
LFYAVILSGASRGSSREVQSKDLWFSSFSVFDVILSEAAHSFIVNG